MQSTFNRRAVVAGASVLAVGFAGSRFSAVAAQDHQMDSDATRTLQGTFYRLWSEHMQYTYETVDAFFHDQDALQPYLDRLLFNQQEIGDAFKPYYGDEAGQRIADLLTVHIQLAVPVLEAAQAGDDQALTAALDDWYANAEENGLALSELNPDNWPPDVFKGFLRMHIDQTVVYATDLMKKNYASAIASYDVAHGHMLMLPNILTDGIVAQFPDRFA